MRILSTEPYSCLLISNKFFNGGGSCPSRVIIDQGPLCTCSSTPLSMGPETPLVHKTTYAPMIYTALCIMFWMRADPLLGQVGGGWVLEFSRFLGLKWCSPTGSMPFHRTLSSPNCPRYGYARFQNIMHGAV